MLTGQILSSDTTLNNFSVLDSKSFIPGEEFVLFMRILNAERDDLRYIPVVTAIVTLTFNNNDSTTLAKVATALTDDRSIVSVSISELESVDLAGGNFTFKIDVLGDGTQILKGITVNGLSKIIDGDC